ncbi:MAG: hypothetical protein N0C89_02690 [Candidatus Thiodiazotropha endolucinida]|nr:hypothetical protein [Candidatus Thiodiazotropha taylori]MCG8097385.1 hypothetical protein [Candidatus Thiodiazotropha endolucinida]MCG8060788.1 hypothetical protein [Candidatus Thiodiazotropha taylori]MCG8063071.1 hypothetical protein [Candidatus Thiodiazotropha taylori]MCW4329150.1 hypothetical protein [Candidatus Thiodiazotropha endolucinida]
MSEQLERMMKKLEGDGPVEKQVILLKLTEALEHAPEFGDKAIMEPASPQRQWLSRVGALLSRLGLDKQVQYRASFQTLFQNWKPAITQIQGQVLDAIEELKLELELDGRSEIGNAYEPGDVYKFFADLKSIISDAENELLIVDPYFNGEAFNAYLSEVDASINVRVLADRYSKDIKAYVDKHIDQYGSSIEIKRSKELHDRIVFIDDGVSWIMGGSIKDAGKKATYLIPLATPITEAKYAIYNEIWARASNVE